MCIILNQIITDENLAWDNTLESKNEKFFVKLNEKSLNEVLKNKENLENGDKIDFPLLTEEITNLKKKILIDGSGLMIIDGISFSSLNIEQKKLLHMLLSKIIGEPLTQNKKNEIHVLVKDLEKSMKDGARYHHTKEGGSFHTDGFHIYHNAPDIVGLLCINPAKNGGMSRFVSAYTVHNKLLKKQRNFLELLYTNFYMDKRGEFVEGESPTLYEPIFEYVDGKLNFKYQREYIEGGHTIQKSPLNKKQIASLDYLDSTIKEPDGIIEYALKAGDMMFHNNNRIIHDRTDFEDYVDPNLKRTLIRTWIRNVE